LSLHLKSAENSFFIFDTNYEFWKKIFVGFYFSIYANFEATEAEKYFLNE